MPLPDIVEVIPPAHPVQACVTLPGSKSLTNRALVLAAIARQPVTLEGALWSEDTQVMIEALERLGFEVQISADPQDAGNRTLVVQGRNGLIPRGGTAEAPLELFVGNAGTAARFLTALVCLGEGWYRLDGVPRMRERPQAELFQALRELGYRLEAEHDRLPVTVQGRGPRAASCRVSIQQSSQFASALLLVARAGGWSVTVDGENSEESAYVAMSRELLRVFPFSGGRFTLEPDASSGSYFWAARHLYRERFGPAAEITLARWPTSGWQIDQHFPRFLPLPSTLSRRTDLGDSIMTAIVLAPLAGHRVQFTDLGRLRLQECERVQALRTELTRCGAQVEESGDTLTVSPTGCHGATIETYGDHRLAMSFATLGLHVPGVRLKNPACVAKTFPQFFHKLAAPPPAGLGLSLVDPLTRQSLSPDALLPHPV